MREHLPWLRPSGWPTRLLRGRYTSRFSVELGLARRGALLSSGEWYCTGNNGRREADSQRMSRVDEHWARVCSGWRFKATRSIREIDRHWKTQLRKRSITDDSWHELRREQRATQEESGVSGLSVQNHTRSGSVYWMDSPLSTILSLPSSSSGSCTQQFTGSLFLRQNIYLKVLISSFLRICNHHNLTKI